MPAFPKPKFAYDYVLSAELTHLRKHKKTRAIPAKDDDHLLIATWNLANFGVQERREQDLKLMATIIKWFDLIALQEVRQNLDHLKTLLSFLGKNYAAIYTDASGNNERMVFLYDSTKLHRRELVGEVAPYPSDLKNIKFESVSQKFQGFDRNPFVQSFRWKDFDFCLANVHLYFGSAAKEQESIERRQLEAYAVARWANMQAGAKFNAEPNMILLGDFNLPHMAPDDPIYRALTKYGLKPTAHATEIGATLPSEPQGSTIKIFHYDQIAFVPQLVNRYTGETGTFDFDSAIFKELWAEVENGTKRQSDFNAFVKYYISDHRPLWIRLGKAGTP